MMSFKNTRGSSCSRTSQELMSWTKKNKRYQFGVRQSICKNEMMSRIVSPTNEVVHKKVELVVLLVAVVMPWSKNSDNVNLSSVINVAAPPPERYQKSKRCFLFLFVRMFCRWHRSF